MTSILIVEDEVLVGLDLLLQLEDSGFHCIGPKPNVGSALNALEREAVWFAVLDANLGGQSSAPIAERLSALGIPFVYVSGYGIDYVRENLPPSHLLPKPLDVERLIALLHTCEATGKTASALG